MIPEPLDLGSCWAYDTHGALGTISICVYPSSFLPDLLVLPSFRSLWALGMIGRSLLSLLEPGHFLGVWSPRNHVFFVHSTVGCRSSRIKCGLEQVGTLRFAQPHLESEMPSQRRQGS